EENVPMPTWLANAYLSALTRFLTSAGLPSLDDVFHSEHLPTHTRLKGKKARQEWQLGLQLYDAIWRVADRHTSMDRALDDVLTAKKWGVQKTTARRLIEMVE